MATAFAAMSLPDEDEHESEWSAWSRTVDHWTIGACLALYAIGVVLAFHRRRRWPSERASRCFTTRGGT